MNKEQKVIDLPCLVVCNGTCDKYTETLEMQDDALSFLEDLKGKDVLIRGREDYYCYVGEDDPEDQSHVEKKLSGKITEVSKNGIKLDIESGERVYSKLSSAPISVGEADLPFYRHDFHLKNNASIEAIEGIISDGIEYRIVR